MRVSLILTILSVCTMVYSLSAQSQYEGAALLSPAYQYSKKKTSYITLKDGTELIGNVKDFDRKKGQIDYIKIKANDGKTHKLKAEEIKFGYFHPSGLSSLMSVYDDLKVQRWDKDLQQDLFTEGYVYLENTMVQIKKKRVELLMQLLNPHFSDGIRIYHDVFAKKSTSLGVGPVTVAGGNAKSYYVKKAGTSLAIRLKKKDYDDEFKAFFGSCPAVMNMEKKHWMRLPQHAMAFAEECAGE